jgi:endonuclease III
MDPPRTLSTVGGKLLEHYGATASPELDDPFHLILWEQVAYLVDDEGREAAFQLLKRRVGLSPRKVLAASRELLVEIARSGGSIGVEKRAGAMQESALRAVSDWGGDLKQVLHLPTARAVRELAKFPMIGKPGAEKILLLTKADAVLALDSNGLRVLLRLGYGQEESSYAKTYASVRAATAPEEHMNCDWLISLHGLLRRHGQVLCRRTHPECARCPLTSGCAYYGAHVAAKGPRNRRAGR